MPLLLNIVNTVTLGLFTRRLPQPSGLSVLVLLLLILVVGGLGAHVEGVEGAVGTHAQVFHEFLDKYQALGRDGQRHIDHGHDVQLSSNDGALSDARVCDIQPHHFFLGCPSRTSTVSSAALKISTASPCATTSVPVPGPP